MDEFNFGSSNKSGFPEETTGMDTNEIDRIQREIDRDLASIKAVAEIGVDSVELSPVAVVPMAEPVPAILREDESAAPTEQKPDMAAREAFYTETIKHETYKNRKNRFKRTIAIVCIVSVLGGSFLGFGIGLGGTFAREVLIPGITGQNKGDTSEESNEPKAEETAFAFNDGVDAMSGTADKLDYFESSGVLVDIVNKVEPSVCSINVVIEGTQDYFNIPYSQDGSGSGIVFSESDDKVFIATNYHVVGGASSVFVSIMNSEPVPAYKVGTEPQSDLAVIYIEKEALKKAGVDKVVIGNFGDSDQMQVGETVLAIGNALGEGNTATVGIVSAKDKEITVEDKTLTVIQTDAAINPGNSGGPLVNTKGEIIGINTAKLSQSSVEGMGYSITSNVAKPIITDLMNQKPKPFLGIMGFTVTEEIADMYNLPMIGVCVNSVVEGSSAEKAGIERLDIITSFDNEPIFTMEQLSEAIKNREIGDEVEVKLLREGKTVMTIKVVLAENNMDNF